MTQNENSHSEKAGMDRRKFLTILTALFGAVGAAFAATPFLRSMSPSRRTEAIGAPVRVDIADLEAGKLRTVQWRQKPIWIMRRTPEQVASIASSDSLLADPLSKASVQPQYAQNTERGRNPAVGVITGVCTHFGCVPIYRAEEGALPHFFCPCHGSAFDLAGRVYKNMPAPLNLPIPPHYFESETVLVIGADAPENA